MGLEITNTNLNIFVRKNSMKNKGWKYPSSDFFPTIAVMILGLWRHYTTIMRL